MFMCFDISVRIFIIISFLYISCVGLLCYPWFPEGLLPLKSSQLITTTKRGGSVSL